MLFKKLIRVRPFILILAIILTMSFLIETNFPKATADASDTQYFTDVKDGEWYALYVNSLAAMDIVKGMGDGTFGPGLSITRAQYTALLVRSLGLESRAFSGIFSDVKEDKWYAAEIEAAHDYGIAIGTGNGKFEPEAGISREAATLMIANIISVKEGKTLEELASDEPIDIYWSGISDWAVNGVKVCQKYDIIQGYPDGTFNAQKKVTRAESAKIIFSLINSYLLFTPEPTATIEPSPSPSPGRQLKVAVTSVKLRLGSKAANLTEILKLVDKTANGCSPDVIVLSESIYTRSNPGDQQHEAVPGTYFNAIADKCRQYNCYIVFNLNEMRDGKAYNTDYMLDKQGNIVGRYDKYHPAPAEIDPPFNIVAGTDTPVYDTEFGKVGFEICYDLDPIFNNDVTQKLKEKGAELIFISTMGDYTFSAKKGAEDYNVWMIVGGQDKYQTGVDSYPASAIIKPGGEILAGVTDRTCSELNWPAMCYREGDGSYTYATIDIDNPSLSIPPPTATPAPN